MGRLRGAAVAALVVLAGLMPAVTAVPAQAAAQRCLATARLVSQTSHDTTIRHTNGCGQVRAYNASSVFGYRFGPWVTASGATSHVHTLRVAHCGGWQGGNGVLHRLWGVCN